jgi:hypothetical protein
MSEGEAARRRFSAFLVRTTDGPECAGTGLLLSKCSKEFCCSGVVA